MTTNHPKTTRRSFPVLKTLIGLGVFATLCLVGAVLAIPYYVSETVREAEAEADRLDPGWRWEEIEARREVLSDETNSANLVAEIIDVLPDEWTNQPPKKPEGSPDWSQLRGLALRDAIPIDRPNTLLTDEQADAVG
ncbi:hypothetical protein ACYOEI_42525, partial [Singulisphaera rosea]